MSDVILPAILHGGDYNPEQWPEEVWDDDVRLMQAAHCNVATVPVFGWVSLQPDEDTFTFEWLDRVLDKLHAGGIGACLATATASTPAWLDQKYPDVLRVGHDGRKMKHQGRHSFCPHSANFRRLSVGLARRLAERYKDHPALKVWHVSNEYGSYCFCDTCATAFREWLAARYGSLDEVNRRWNTRFWGHTYTDWSQIETPTSNGERSILGLLLDYDRFQSDSLLAAFEAEYAVLKSITPNVPITTNLMGAFKPLDYHKWGRAMDIVSWDSYPPKGQPPADTAFYHTLMRGLKEGAPFMLMEQTPSQVNWMPRNSLKEPGRLRLISYQAMAHGADAVMYFQWRRSRGGPEKFHGAVVAHVGTGETRVFEEVSAMGAEFERLGARTLGGRVPARATILFDWDNWWAAEYSPGPSIDLRYVENVKPHFAAFHALGIPVEIVSPDADLSRFDLIVAPMLYMVKPGIAEKLAEHVRRGGAFVTTYFSGIVDESDLVHLGGYPGPFRDVCGVWVEEIDALQQGETNSVRFADSFGALHGERTCRIACDRIHLEGAEALAVYGGKFYAGEPAVTVNRFGTGRAYYLGTALDADSLAAFFAQVCADAGISGLLPAAPPAGVEVNARVSPSGEELLYVLNHNAEPMTVGLPTGACIDLLTGGSVQGSAELAGLGVAILSRREAA
jgi:beta-galactosidase